jgi:hypothetical protein
MLKNVFEKYGHIYLSEKNNKQIQFACNLNMTFDFLLEKEDDIEEWILENNKHFAAFLGGYIDAEGHFGIYNNFAEFSISTYDRKIINLLYSKLSEMGIEGSEPKITVKKGYIDKRGIKCRGDLWRFRITRKKELLKFIRFIEKYIKHKKRRDDMIKAKDSLIRRI